MDDHTLRYHVLTSWKCSSREQSGWGYIQSYGGLVHHRYSHEYVIDIACTPRLYSIKHPMNPHRILIKSHYIMVIYGDIT